MSMKESILASINGITHFQPGFPKLPEKTGIAWFDELMEWEYEECLRRVSELKTGDNQATMDLI